MSTGRRRIKRRIRQMKRSVENIANNLLKLEYIYEINNLPDYVNYIKELQKVLYVFLQYLEKFEEMV